MTTDTCPASPATVLTIAYGTEVPQGLWERLWQGCERTGWAPTETTCPCHRRECWKPYKGQKVAPFVAPSAARPTLSAAFFPGLRSL